MNNGISEELKSRQMGRVYEHLYNHGELNPMESWKELGIYRLAAVIHLLRKQGYKIKTERMNVQNRFGEDCYVANYRMSRTNHVVNISDLSGIDFSNTD